MWGTGLDGGRWFAVATSLDREKKCVSSSVRVHAWPGLYIKKHIVIFLVRWTRNPHSGKQMDFIYVCLSLASWKCPSSAASCVKVGDEYMSLGQVKSPPTWDGGVLKLEYTSGQACPDGQRNRSSEIRFKCDKVKVVSNGMFLGLWNASLWSEPTCVSVPHPGLSPNSNLCHWGLFLHLYVVNSCCLPSEYHPAW